MARTAGQRCLRPREPAVTDVGVRSRKRTPNALEDIDPDCGPLLYVPGSHRIPYYELAPKQYAFDATTMGEKEIAAGRKWDEEQCHARGLTVRHFTPKRGEVLIWHHSLLHGGAAIKNEALSRKSFVVHFSSKAHYHRRGITVSRGDGRGGFTSATALFTEEILERNGCIGFGNPLEAARVERQPADLNPGIDD